MKICQWEHVNDIHCKTTTTLKHDTQIYVRRRILKQLLHSYQLLLMTCN